MPFFFLLPDKHIREYRKFIGLFVSQKMPDDILRLILLATMVERKDDELQAGGILLQRLLHGMEVTAAVGMRVLWDSIARRSPIPRDRVYTAC